MRYLLSSSRRTSYSCPSGRKPEWRNDSPRAIIGTSIGVKPPSSSTSIARRENKKTPSSYWDEERLLAVPPNLIEPAAKRAQSSWFRDNGRGR